MPPAPGQSTNYEPLPVYPSDIFPKTDGSRNRELPQNILALMVEFEDVTFDLEPDFPDSLAHDKAYFERLFFHVAAYWNDASHGQYALTEDNYTVWDNVFTVPETMGYYGEDDSEGHQQIELICEFVQDLLTMADAEIDFSQYDAFVIIHAGAGQETDVDQADEIFTTFLSRRSLQAGIDPENDDYPGIEADGILLKEFVIIPETENQPGIEPGDTIYGLQGVLAHNFGHQLGLPTLFDNDHDNGRSYGIGGFGVMGTGVWIANSIVPPLPCAWSRYYLGWEDDNIVELNVSAENLEITFPTADDDLTPKLYKLNITENEYFLIENRQQNPDGSIQIWSELDSLGNVIALDPAASFTFPLVADQKYYPYPNEDKPKFDYMINSFAGSEWDFYLPGLGGYTNGVFDGSGILIWHIDESVINANFDPEFEHNTVNAYSPHKGVDLEEASGIQYLDSNFYGYDSFFGSGNDSYRADNNDYFGKRVYQDLFRAPTAESYYGGIPLEVKNIGESGTTMFFTVEYEWALNASYIGQNTYPAAIINYYDNSENNLMFYPMPDGHFYLWEGNEIVETFPRNIGVIPQIYAYDSETKSVIIPCETDDENYCRLYTINEIEETYPIFIDKRWAASPVINTDTVNQNRAILPFVNLITELGIIITLDSDYNILCEKESDYKISSNLMLKENIIYFLDEDWELITMSLADLNEVPIQLSIIGDKPEIWSALLADIDADGEDDIVITAADSLLHVFHHDGSYMKGFPVEIPLQAISLPSIDDIDGNGYPDILIGGENTFAIIHKNGEIWAPSTQLSNPDSTYNAAGIIAVDLDEDGQKEIMGNMSRNRLCVWRNDNDNDWVLDHNFPVSLGERSLNYPILGTYHNEFADAYIAANNGVVFRDSLGISIASVSGWIHEYGNLQRTASWQFTEPQGPTTSSKVFDKDETYFYPNPLSTIFNKAIDNGHEVADQTIILRIMTQQNVDVDIKIFDIAANKIYANTVYCENGFASKVYIDASKLSSGVYFAVLKAKEKVLKLKFAIEK